MKLNEWKDSKGNKINTGSTPSAPVVNKTSNTSSNKDKFVKLMYNMMKNKLPSVTDVKCVRVDDNGFTYKEVRKSLTSGEFTLVLLVGYENDDSWKSEFYMDSKLLETKQGTGMADLIRYIGQYFSVPDIGTKEYQSLTEWVDSNGKKVSLSKSSSNTSSQPASSNKTSAKNYPDQTDRYKRLLAQIDADKTCKYIVNLLDDRILAITINSAKGDLGFKIIFKPYVPCYSLQLTTKESVKELSREDFEEVLDLLLDAGLINNTDLCESISSIADDFKAYENLWD